MSSAHENDQLTERGLEYKVAARGLFAALNGLIWELDGLRVLAGQCAVEFPECSPDWHRHKNLERHITTARDYGARVAEACAESVDEAVDFPWSVEGGDEPNRSLIEDAEPVGGTQRR